MSAGSGPRPTPVVAGNWKMHHGPDATRRFLRAFDPPEGPDVLLFPPSLSLPAAVEAADGRVGLGVQNVHWEDEGAFTGEVSAPMAREAGARWALVGHSERRHVFGESDEDVTRKVRAALTHDLVPVVCVGETLDQRRSGRLEDVLLRQLDAALEGMGDDPPRFLLAYEPVWAIGTGETATPEDAAHAHGLLRAHMVAALGEDRARRVSVLYGGSVKPHNAEELLDAPDVDGVLVGGASLDPDDFAAIAAAAARD